MKVPFQIFSGFVIWVVQVFFTGIKKERFGTQARLVTGFANSNYCLI